MNNTQATSAVQESAPILIDALNYSICTLFLIISSYLLLYFTSGLVVKQTLEYADIRDENSSKRDTGTAIGKVENVLTLMCSTLLISQRCLDSVFKSVPARFSIQLPA